MEGTETMTERLWSAVERIKLRAASLETFHSLLVLTSVEMLGAYALLSSDNTIPVSLRAKEDFGPEVWRRRPKPTFKMPPALGERPPRGSLSKSVEGRFVVVLGINCW